jgi:hypothetical protein
MDNALKSYYEYWKRKYVRESNGITPSGGYYVFNRGTEVQAMK